MGDKYCTDCGATLLSNADVNRHYRTIGHTERSDVYPWRLLRAGKPRPAFSESPTQAEIDATLASIGMALSQSEH